MNELIPDQPFIVCGNSYGGYIARGIVRLRQDKVRGLLLMAPIIFPEIDDRLVPQQTVLRRDSNLISQLSSEDADQFISMV